MLPKVADFFARIPLNKKLWKALKSYARREEDDSLNPIQKRFLEETMAEFRDHGSDLPAVQKERLRSLAQELAAVIQKFSENVLDATNAYELVVSKIFRKRSRCHQRL